MNQTAGDAIKQQVSYEQIYRTTGLRDHLRFYRWIVRMLPLKHGARLLDVACGEGGVLEAAREYPVEACGVDISLHALAMARVRHRTSRVVGGDAERLPFASGSFDCVTCLGSLENFARPTVALAEMHRVLRPRGTLCAMMPNRFWLGDVLQAWCGGEEQVPFQRFERLATIRQWRRLLESSGFLVTRVRGYGKTAPLMAAGKLRSIRKFLFTRLIAACPPPVAWSLVYLCEQSSTAVGPEANGGVWVWRAERLTAS